MNAQDLILRIVHLRPSVTTFHIAKLAYLFDIACVQVFGKPKSGIPFRWFPYGPYCEEIEAAIWQLEDDGAIRIEPHHTRTGHDCRLHSPARKSSSILPPELDELLEAVVKRYARQSTEALGRLVYATPPMVSAQRKKARFKPLDLTDRTGVAPDLYDPVVMRMLARSAKTPRARYVPIEKVFAKLQAAPARCSR